MMILITSMGLLLQALLAVHSGIISQGGKLPLSIEFSEDVLKKTLKIIKRYVMA
jgi:hypothetical protein